MLSIKIHTGKGYLFSNTIKQNKIQCSLQKSKKERLIMVGDRLPGEKEILEEGKRKQAKYQAEANVRPHTAVFPSAFV